MKRTLKFIAVTISLYFCIAGLSRCAKASTPMHSDMLPASVIQPGQSAMLPATVIRPDSTHLTGKKK